MSKEYSLPTMADLAAPFQQVDALPHGIDMSVGIIANTAPGTLKEVTGQTFVAFNVAKDDAQRYAPEGPESYLVQRMQNATRHRELDASLTDTHAAELGRFLGLGLRENVVPSVKALEDLLQLHDKVAEANRVASKAPDDDPKVIEARNAVEAAAEKRAAAEQRIQKLQTSKALALEVQHNVSRLARRGRFASIAAGAAMMAGVSLGVFEAIEDSQTNQKAQAVQINEAHPEDVVAREADAQEKRMIGVAAASLTGGIIGGLVSLPLTGRFAKWRASGMIRRARNRQ